MLISYRDVCGKAFMNGVWLFFGSIMVILDIPGCIYPHKSRILLLYFAITGIEF